VRGIFPNEYVANPDHFEVEDAYVQMDGFSWEEFEPKELTYSIVLLPPLRIGGRAIKGLLFSPGVEVLNAHCPSLKDHFLTIANSRWCGYPWSTSADGWFTCYPNAHRVARYERRAAADSVKTLVPAQTADYTSELQFSPHDRISKDIDILVVARVHACKNLSLLARSLATLRKKHTKRRYRAVWAIGRSISEAARFDSARHIIAEMEKVLGSLTDYIEPIGKIQSKDMPALYSRARATFLPSKIEGKNRSIVESLCCDVPTVVLSEYNSVARGETPVFACNAGLTVESHADAVADGLAVAVDNYGDFHSRDEYLKVGGRMNFLWECLRSFHYFREMLPLSFPDKCEVWLDEMMHETYGIGIREFTFFSSRTTSLAMKHELPGLSRADGLVQTKKLLDAYSAITA